MSPKQLSEREALELAENAVRDMVQTEQINRVSEDRAELAKKIPGIVVAFGPIPKLPVKGLDYMRPTKP